MSIRLHDSSFCSGLIQYGVPEHLRCQELVFGTDEITIVNRQSQITFKRENGKVNSFVDQRNKTNVLELEGFRFPLLSATRQEQAAFVKSHYFRLSILPGSNSTVYKLMGIARGLGGGSGSSVESSTNQLTVLEKASIRWMSIMNGGVKNKEKLLKIAVTKEYSDYFFALDRDMNGSVKNTEEILKNAVTIEHSDRWRLWKSELDCLIDRHNAVSGLLKQGTNPNILHDGRLLFYQCKDDMICASLLEGGANWKAQDKHYPNGGLQFILDKHFSSAFLVIIDQIDFASNQKAIVFLVNVIGQVIGLQYFKKWIPHSEATPETRTEVLRRLICLHLFVGHMDASERASWRYALQLVCQTDADPNSRAKHSENCLLHLILDRVTPKSMEDSKFACTVLMQAKKKVDLTVKDANGVGLLYKVAKLGWDDIFGLMLDNGADVNERHPTEGPLWMCLDNANFINSLIFRNVATVDVLEENGNYIFCDMQGNAKFYINAEKGADEVKRIVSAYVARTPNVKSARILLVSPELWKYTTQSLLDIVASKITEKAKKMQTLIKEHSPDNIQMQQQLAIDQQHVQQQLLPGQQKVMEDMQKLTIQAKGSAASAATPPSSASSSTSRASSSATPAVMYG